MTYLLQTYSILLPLSYFKFTNHAVKHKKHSNQDFSWNTRKPKKVPKKSKLKQYTMGDS